MFSLGPGLGWHSLVVGREGKGCFGSFSTTSSVCCSMHFFLPTNCQFYDIKRTFSPHSPLISFTPLSKFSQTICKENHGLKFGQNPVKSKLVPVSLNHCGKNQDGFKNTCCKFLLSTYFCTKIVEVDETIKMIK